MKPSNVLNDRTSHFVLIHTWIFSFVYYLDIFLKLPPGPFGSLSNICFSTYLVAPFLILILAPNWKQAIRQVFLASLSLPSGFVLIWMAANVVVFFLKKDFGHFMKQTQGMVPICWLLWQMCISVFAPILLLAASSKWAFQKIKRPNSK